MMLIKKKKMLFNVGIIAAISLLVIIGNVLFGNISPTPTAEALTINSVTPNTGDYTGGNSVTIAVSDFLPATPTTMQEMTQAYCASLPVYNGTNPEAIKIIPDTRNGQNYQIAKLANNNCWMLNNLKLGSTSPIALTNADTNLPAGTTSFDLPALTTSNIYSYAQSYLYADNFDTGANKSATTDIASPYFYGYYYNWCAAMGGQARACTTSDIYPTATSGDICPVSWRLPTGGDTGEFAVLNGSMYNGILSPADTASDAAHVANFQFAGPFKGVFSGSHTDTSWSYQGSYGNFWSSSYSPILASRALFFSVDSGNVYSGSAPRSHGRSIRCLTPGGTPQVPPAVTVGDTPVTITAYDASTITITTPSHEPGPVDITITFAGSTYTLSNAYTYTRNYAISFNTDGGSAIADQTLAQNSSTLPMITKPANPTKDDFIFDRWFTEPELLNEYDFSTGVDNDITLYAGYREACTSTDPECVEPAPSEPIVPGAPNTGVLNWTHGKFVFRPHNFSR